MFWAATNLLFALSIQVLPAFSDEYSYFLSARAFAKNFSLVTPLDYYGPRSNIGVFSAHGPFYSFAYGIIPALFDADWIGWMVIQNSLLLAGAIVLAWHTTRTQKVQWRICAMLVVLTGLVPLAYQTHFMVEPLHVFFALVLTAVFFVPAPAGQWRHVLLTTLLVFIFSLFRIVWVVGYLAVFMYARKPKQVLGAVLLSASAFVVNMYLYANLFSSFEGGFFDTFTTDLFLGEWRAAAAAISDNIKTNWNAYFSFKTRFDYDITKMLYLLVLLVLGVQAVKERRQDLGFVFLLYLSVFVLLFTLYAAYGWREHRILAPFYMLAAIALLSTKARLIVAGLVAAQVTASPVTIASSLNAFAGYRADAITVAARNAPELASSATIVRSLSDKNGDGGLFIAIEDSDFRLDANPVLFSLPVRSIAGQPIRYSILFSDEPYRQPYDHRLSDTPCRQPDAMKAFGLHVCPAP